MLSKEKRITQILNDMIENDNIEVISAWNNYQSEVGGENSIYSMDEFDEIMSGFQPWEVARAAFFGEFNPTKDYFKFNGYGNLESMEGYEISENIYIEDMAEYAVRNDEDFCIDAIRDVLNGSAA